MGTDSVFFPTLCLLFPVSVLCYSVLRFSHTACLLAFASFAVAIFLVTRGSRAACANYACLSAAQMFTTHGIIQMYVTSDFIGVHSCVV